MALGGPEESGSGWRISIIMRWLSIGTIWTIRDIGICAIYGIVVIPVLYPRIGTIGGAEADDDDPDCLFRGLEGGLLQGT